MSVLSFDRVTTFHSSRAFDLEEGGVARVTQYAYRDNGGIRTHVSIEPPGSLLTDRDVAILAMILSTVYAPAEQSAPATAAQP